MFVYGSKLSCVQFEKVREGLMFLNVGKLHVVAEKVCVLYDMLAKLKL